MLALLELRDVKDFPCNLLIFTKIPIIVNVPKEFCYENNIKVLNYPFIQCNHNKIDGTKVGIGELS